MIKNTIFNNRNKHRNKNNYNSSNTVIMLYCDEFVSANPLGNKAKKCKISAFYFVLGNLSRKKLSLFSSINLEILCKYFIEKYRNESVLVPLIKDLKNS